MEPNGASDSGNVEKSDSQPVTNVALLPKAPPSYMPPPGQGAPPGYATPGYPPQAESYVLLPPNSQVINMSHFERQTVAVLPGTLMQFSVQTMCPTCQTVVMTKITRNITAKTHLGALIYALLCGAACMLMYLHVRQEFSRAHIFFFYVPFVFAFFMFTLCFCPCMCVPYCLPDCKETVHNCPLCNTWLGTRVPWYDRMFQKRY